MKRRIFVFVGLFFATPLLCLAQSSGPPLARAEILGRLALGYSPSYIAHLVKIRGVDFSADDHFLSLVELAGGSGILHERLASAEATSTVTSLSDSETPYDHLGKCAEFAKLGYPEKAEPECRSSIDENSRSAWPILAELRTIRSTQEGTAPDADVLARRAVELDPSLPEAHNEMAIHPSRTSEDAAESTYEFQRTNTLYSDAREADPLFQMSLEADEVVPNSFSQDDFTQVAEAEAKLQQRIALDPDVANTHSYASSFYELTSQPDLAISEIRTAIELEPDNANFHQRLAKLLGKQGDIESEISELRAAIQCKPYDISRRMYLAGRLEELGRSSEALQEFEELIESKPADWDANNQITDFLVQHKMIPAAIADIRLFLRATADGKVDGNIPDSAEGIRFERQQYLAGLLHRNGELDASATEYVDLMRRYPDNADVHDNYGVVLFAEGKRDEAAGEFREAIRLAPDFALAHRNLALCMAHPKIASVPQ